MRLGRTLGELGETMSSEEFSLWLALYKRAPWDETRGDINAGIIAATIANYSGKMRSESAPPAQASDFMLFIEKPVAEPEPELDPMEFFGKL